MPLDDASKSRLDELLETLYSLGKDEGEDHQLEMETGRRINSIDWYRIRKERGLQMIHDLLDGKEVPKWDPWD